MTNRLIFATINNYVDKINEKMINIFPGDSKIFSSFEQAMDDTNYNHLEEILNTLPPNDLPLHKLILKVHCLIIVLRNLDPSNDLRYGTKMVHKRFNNNVRHSEITIDQLARSQVLLSRIPLTYRK
ncbi:hypothetical protein E1A91_D02G060800v1 [Gossypium mustelinum]|uniref:DNA helicase Pif1-like 2B domain-containing protein n=1 Tax=Gossypium mustelinum TaxID=34275 RepID=A0A5D2VT36_GOSMU|nr:hypothetical protein E1A91_D02G060800v1 [Gossypium mustelinum]